MVALKVKSTRQRIQTAEHDTDQWQRAHKPQDLNLTGKLVIYSRLRIVGSEKARLKTIFSSVPFFELC